MGCGKVSIITPTYGRERFLRLAHESIAAQTYRDWEWLVLDDSPSPSAYLQRVNDPRIRYRHSPQRLKIGHKRNELVAASSGAIVAHFDDDDYYAPRYLERMVARLDRGYDFVKLSGWYLYAVSYRAGAYWDLNRKVGRHHVWSPPQPATARRLTRATNAGLEDNHLGYGFSYVYRKAVWERRAFPDDLHWNEDTPFALAARDAFRLTHFRDVRGICLHVLHEGNTSRCFPQYVVPAAVLRWIFPPAIDEYLAMRRL